MAAPGRRQVFFTEDKLRSVDVSGGPVATLCDCLGAEGTWSARDTILFATSQGIVSVAGKGGTTAKLTTIEPGEIAHLFPRLLPDARHFLYLATKLGQSSIYVADMNAGNRVKSRREILQVPTDSRRGTEGAVFVPPGFLLYRRGSTLMAQRFDPDKTQIVGARSSLGTSSPLLCLRARYQPRWRTTSLARWTTSGLARRR